jgi:hypothetical protein
MHEIKSFKIVQTAKVIAVVYAISFTIFAIIELLVFAKMGGRTPPLIPAVMMPVIGTIFTFIGVALLCWLYNTIALRIGGIAFELTPRNEN